MDYYSLLKKSSLFKGIPTRELRDCLKDVPYHIQSYKKDEIVFHLMELSYMMGINSGIANASKLMYYIGAVLSVVYWMFFLRSGKSEECTIFNKVLYWSTGIFAVVQVVFSVAFGLIFIK